MTLPECAVCNKPVDELIQLPHSPFRRSVVYIARCHGAEERVELSDADLVAAKEITVGRAFCTPLLEEL